MTEGLRALVPGYFRVVTDGFLETIGAKIVAGRSIGAIDVAGGYAVAVVSVSAARRLWPDVPGAAVVGREIVAKGQPTRRVVGVVTDVRARNVALRRYELGVRSSLGPSAATLRRTVILDAVWPVAVGTVIGLVASYWISQWVQALVYQIDARDPSTFAVVALTLLVTSVAAASPPARRGEVTSGFRRDAASARRQFENHAAGVPIRGGTVSAQAQRETSLPN